MVETTENQEGIIILVTTISSAATGFVAAIPLPLEWKAPIISLTTAITGAVLYYWKTKVNVRPTTLESVVVTT